MKIPRAVVYVVGPALVGAAVHVVTVETIETSRPPCWIQFEICQGQADVQLNTYGSNIFAASSS